MKILYLFILNHFFLPPSLITDKNIELKFNKITRENYFIYTANSNLIHEDYSLEMLLELLPTQFHERALRYRKEEDVFNFILGRLMLIEALVFFDLPISNVTQLTYTENGQPLIEGIYFNISHSGTYVVCAVAKKEAIGIDIEVIRPIEIEHLRKPFTEKEWNIIVKSPNVAQQLLDLWTKKEAVLKLYGAGIGAVEKVDLVSDAKAIFDQNNKCTLETIIFDDKVLMSIALGIDETSLAFI